MHPTFQHLHNFPHKPQFIFLDPGRLGMNPNLGGLGQDDEEEAERDRQEREEERKEQRSRRDTGNRIERSRLSPRTKQQMREDLAGDSADRHELIDRFLRGEIDSEAAFRQEHKELEQQEESWGKIFSVQRKIRKDIADLQYRGESYVELIPRKRVIFEGLLKDVRGINRQDEGVERDLTSQLYRLVNGDTDARGALRRGGLPSGTLTKKEVQEVYEAKSSDSDFTAIMSRFQGKINAVPGNEVIFKKILALKREEARIERDFLRVAEKFDKVVQENLKKTRRKLEKERILKEASKAVGITLKESTKISFREPDILALQDPNATSATIARITWDEIPVRDHHGTVIDKVPGIPFIWIVNGTEKAKMPLGRFKKWVDATDAVEDTASVADVERATGLEPFGINIKAGTELTYPKRTQNQRGELETTPVYVRISEIKDGRIYFDSPVPYLPGLSGKEDTYDFRESLSFGEFVKWWHRYEVEKSLGLAALRELLLKFNELENQEYGIEAKENPPIVAEIGEELRYPDEMGATFRIINVDTEGIAIDNGLKYTFSEFFYWVRNNHVEKIPSRETSPEERTKADERYKELEKEKQEEEALGEKKFQYGMEQDVAAKSDAVHREAGTLIQKIRDAYFHTTFLSLNDLWNMIKEVVEFVKRKHDRRSKGRFAEVGSRIPGVLGTEFERIKQSAETEEVNKYKEAMEHWGIEQVKHSLHRTNDKDEAKACVMTLVHKGEMRWDDHHFWGTLNRLTSRYTLRGAELHIPLPELMPQGESGEDLSIFAMDALWGEGTGSEWFMENTNKYNSNKNNFEFKFKQLENDPKGTGGPAGECKRMLKRWKAGGYVNAQEYESMIDGAIKFGKMSAEDKMFFIMAGVLARQGSDKGAEGGETLLHIDRMGELDSKYLNQFPLLDFFTVETVFDPAVWDDVEKKWGKERKLRLEDYERMMHEYFPNDFKKNKYGEEFSRFMWEVMMMSEMVRTRITKGIRNAENMDHDDAHLYIPPTTPSEIDGLTTGPTGQKKYFTNSGYANAYPGFGQYLISLSYAVEEETDDAKKTNKMMAIRDTVNAFIRYDAILDNRLLKKEGDHRARLDDRHYSRHPVVDSEKLRLHQKQLRNLVLEIGKAYGQDWASWLYGAKTGSVFDKAEAAKQLEYERRIDGLKDLIPQLMSQDNGAKALSVVQRMRDAGLKDSKKENALRGIPKSRRPKPEEIKVLKANARKHREEMMHRRLGHGGGH